jgi:hypothetical protein
VKAVHNDSMYVFSISGLGQYMLVSKKAFTAEPLPAGGGELAELGVLGSSLLSR